MNNPYLDFIQKAMDISAYKRNTIADNISNYNTPGFKATNIDFQQSLKNALNEGKNISLKGTNEKHITNSSDVIASSQDFSTEERADGNNVNLNAEMVDMIKNNYLYDISVQAANKEFTLEKEAIGK